MNQKFKPKQLPAFPLKMKGPCMFAGVDLPAGTEIEWAGMTLRDYFAAKSLAIIYIEADDDEHAAQRAYELADAMLEARQK